MIDIHLPSDDKEIEKIVDRRHPTYYENIAHWTFCGQTYTGGREWFDTNLSKYIKEGDDSYQNRIARAYRFNHTREAVHLVTKYIFKSKVSRNHEDASDEVNRFWKSSTIDGLTIDEFMRQVSNLNSVYGRVWIVTDTTKIDPLESIAESRNAKNRIYASIVIPENVLDYSVDEFGELNWVIYRISHRDDDDIVSSSFEVRNRYVFWTRLSFLVLEEREETTVKGEKKRVFDIIRMGENEIGRVPIIIGDHAHDGTALIDDIVYLDKAVANYLSSLDQIILDQTFSQLTMPAQGIVKGDDAYEKLLEMGTKSIFIYDGESGKAPEYISPDASQGSLVLQVINKLISEIYHSIGMSGERTKQDNAMGIDNSSGVAKAYDFERMNSLLAAKADILDRVENKLVWFVRLWSGEDIELEDVEDLVHYPDSYDVRGLYDEFEIAQNLSLIEAPEMVRREQMKGLVDKLFPTLAKDLKEKMLKEIDEWPPDVEEIVEQTLMKSERSKGAIGSMRKSPGTSKQGQNTGKNDGKSV